MEEDLKATDVNEGVFKVIDDQDLEQHTRSGWVLMKVLPTTVQVGSRYELVVTPATYVGGFPSTRDNYIQEFGTKHRFLVRRTLNELIEELNAQIASHQTKVQTQSTQLKEFEEQNKKLREELSSAKYRNEDKDAVIRESKETVERLRTVTRRMETDLGKLRKDIGEREFTRIVGDPPPTA